MSEEVIKPKAQPRKRERPAEITAAQMNEAPELATGVKKMKIDHEEQVS